MALATDAHDVQTQTADHPSPRRSSRPSRPGPLRPSHAAVAVLSFAVGVTANGYAEALFARAPSRAPAPRPAPRIDDQAAADSAALGDTGTLGVWVSSYDPLPRSALDAKLRALRASGEDELASELNERIDELVDERDEWRSSGHAIIVGRIVVPEGLDPEAVNAQMRIFPGGWFVDLVEDWREPISFSSPDIPVQGVALSSQPSEVAWLGEVPLRAAQRSERSHVVGIVEAEGVGPEEIEVRVFSDVDAVNTPSHGTEPRLVFAREVTGTVSTSGRFQTIEPLARGHYRVMLSAPDHVKQYVDVDVLGDRPAKLAPVQLEKKKKLSVSWLASRNGRFDVSRVQHRALWAQDHFSGIEPDDGYGHDFTLEQADGELSFRDFYKPSSIADLGPGSLKQFSRVDSDDVRMHDHFGDVKPTRGHVYLIKSNFGYQVLMRVE